MPASCIGVHILIGSSTAETVEVFEIQSRGCAERTAYLQDSLERGGHMLAAGPFFASMQPVEQGTGNARSLFNRLTAA